jgi:murein L,D-transpeptidase YcbB/YkuD
MRRMRIIAVATMLASAPAFGQSSGGAAPLPAKPATAAPVGGEKPAARVVSVKPAIASTPESRSAAALALSHEPTFDQGTAQRIQEAALSYSDLAVRGGWPMIPADAKFALGVQGPQDDLLRQRLLISGDLAADKASSGPYDDVVAEGVKRFQARHSLAPTGTVTPRTLAALNVPVQKRIKQLEASLERLANMNFAFGQRYIVVNLPAAFAEAVENDHVVRRYRVIVGKTEKPSPTLTAEITSVNLNPIWTVPSSISKTEISAHMRKDPGYLSRMHMDVLDAHDAPIDPRSVDWSGARTPNFTVRQQSGAWNALGAVKIDMPNPYSVYMHDTNQRNLFSDDYRFDSHGCSRVDNVRDLAAWLLQEEMPKWNRAAIDAAIATGQREDIALPKKVPVAWIYLTAWMTKDQTIQFRNDIYDQDQQLLEATAEEAAFFNQAGNHPLTAHLAQ